MSARGAPDAKDQPPALAWPSIGAVALAELVLLVATSGGYGFHRDELYFVEAGRHLGFGYPDQPPLTPLLGRLATALFGVSPPVLRLFPEVATAVTVVLGALVAREFGGRRVAQAIAAAAVAVSGAMYAGHLLSTETFDLLFWVALLWLLARLLRTGDERLWLAIGAVTGVALENKDLVLMLAAAVGVGAVVARRFDIFRSRWFVVGAAVAFALWLPNLIWQGLHDWPQLTMSRNISRADGAQNRVELLPFQFVLISPLLVPIWIAGFVWLARSPRARPWRLIAWAYPTLLVITFATGGRPYYPAGILLALAAAGAVVTEEWLRTPARRVLVAVTLVAAAALSALIFLPLVPARTLADTPIPSVNSDAMETIGRPRLARTVAGVFRSLSQAERRSAVVLTENYGEAGAVDHYGPRLGLPRAYSGHNGYGYWGAPPETRAPVIAVGFRDRSYLLRFFADVRLADSIDNGYGIDNDEQGAPVWVCRDLRAPWARLWPGLRHLA